MMDDYGTDVQPTEAELTGLQDPTFHARMQFIKRAVQDFLEAREFEDGEVLLVGLYELASWANLHDQMVTSRLARIERRQLAILELLSGDGSVSNELAQSLKD